MVGGGALAHFFPEYTESERFMDYEAHPSIDALRGVDGLTRVKARKPCTIGKQDLAKGQEATVMRHEVRRLLKHRMVEEIPMPKPEPEAPASADTKESLQAKCAELGIEFDARWGVKKLQEAIEAHPA